MKNTMKKKHVWTIAAIVAVALIAIGIGWEISRSRAPRDDLAHANGRLEMARVDVAVKYAGRVIDLPVREGDLLTADAVVAREDDAELQAQRSSAQAARTRAADAATRAQADIDASGAREKRARLDWTESSKLFADGQVSAVELQRYRFALDGALATQNAARAALDEARAAVAQADAEIARIDAVLAEMTIRAPIAGRVEYRVIETGAVLPAGGRVATMLNPEDIYFTLFLPGPQAGKLAIDADARIVLDAFPDEPIDARIGYVSSDAQFTPKYVETGNERAKLMYRIKLQLPPDAARRLAPRLKAGMTGEGYVRLDSSRPWPPELALRGDAR
ncbi:HlyD family secretion protein [Paraburkholderia caballeronis]|nr:HlyD family secretion protein [Paraburkholderia caballeronis]TDV08402.1 HlyD family secretion protein [Paraburkholderia caballeronis]TDV19759.1 HlyD family secretion protein [Paraburkholderia caballeronis]